MKKLLTLLSIPLLVACGPQKDLAKNITPLKIPDTIYTEKINPLDTIKGQNAYDAGIDFYKDALDSYYSGDTISSKKYFKQSAKMLSQSNLDNEGWLSLEIDKKLNGKNENIFLNDNLEYIQNDVIGYKNGENFTKRVDFWKDYYQGRGKKWFNETLNRIPDYFPYIDSLLKVNDIDPFVKWMYPVESAMKPTIRSKAGAAGISQFMKGTAKNYDLKVYGVWYDERLDAKKSIDASIQYMSKLNSLFNDPFLDIAAYNMGENGILKRLRQTRSTSYEDLVEAKNIPRETRSHLPKIYAFMELANEIGIPKREKNKTIENILSGNFDIITIKKETDIDVIAKILGIKESILRKYNTAYQMPSTPPKWMVKGDYSFDFRIPKGIGTGFEQKIKNVKRRVKNPYTNYIVRRGNTLGGIANRFGVSQKKIMRVNNIKNANKIKPGQRLRIPRY